MITTTLHDHRIIAHAAFPAIVFQAPYTEGYEIDRVQVTLDWFGPNDDEPDEPVGFDVDVRVQGWPLTKKGLRNKAVKQRESIYKADRDSWPQVVHDAAISAFEWAVAQGNVNHAEILGDDGNPGTVKTLL